ncbi:Glutathione S-transferase 3 [Cytospora mali]|uniref:Glutathione S-transferase 3 n=1 Tax=Cytospora mali TaxID=578113 RepID=A0A194V524_CYTMA|nr:Glutathione S-transferase 3 [Valsa mali var. pyri (nom. inval.)]
MPLDVYHLRLSQSERIVWLMEELKVPYNLHVYDRDLKSGLAPQELKGINPFGTAPYFRDTNVSPPVSLSESGAIVEYILQVYGSTEPGSGASRLVRTPDDKEYGEYLEWLHFANGSLQPSAGRMMVLSFAGLDPENPIVKMMTARMNSHLKFVDDRLASNKYLAGEQLSAADIMTVFTLTTMRGLCPSLDLGPYSNVLRYLKDVAERPAYQETLRKGENGMAPMNTPRVKGFTQFEAFRPVLEKYQ